MFQSKLEFFVTTNNHNYTWIRLQVYFLLFPIDFHFQLFLLAFKDSIYIGSCFNQDLEK